MLRHRGEPLFRFLELLLRIETFPYPVLRVVGKVALGEFHDEICESPFGVLYPAVLHEIHGLFVKVSGVLGKVGRILDRQLRRSLRHFRGSLLNGLPFHSGHGLDLFREFRLFLLEFLDVLPEVIDRALDVCGRLEHRRAAQERNDHEKGERQCGFPCHINLLP